MFQKDYERVYDESLDYYVYYLMNPLSGSPFYVGKGKNRRCYQHLTDKMEYSRNKRLTGHIRNLRDSGVEPVVIKICENMMEEDAYILEEQEILKYGRKGFDEGGCLMNIYIANRPEKRFGSDNGFYGKTHSDETKRKISKGNSGKVRSPETRRKISISQKGKPKSDEHKRKIGDKSRGRITKDETKQKLREYNLREDILKKNIESKQKEWIIISPEGVEEFVVNMNKYCLENGLNQGKMSLVASGHRKQHKGYKCRKVDSQ
jgi:hypothetical protein